MRVDGELFLTPGDPAGIEQLLTDETGEEVGRIIYDSFGGVVTSTIPVTLTTAFAGLPDAASGLVHMGGGRWFDPAIGRALQPNPTGGTPAAPQTMSRYAATPLGQPGVAQAAAGSAFNAIPSAISFVYGTSTEIATHALEPSLIEHAFTGYSEVRIVASRNAFKTRLPQVAQSVDAKFTSPNFLEKVSDRHYYESIGIIPLAAKSQDDLFKLSDDIIREFGDALPSKGPYAARINGSVENVVHLRYGASLQKWKGTITGVGAGIDFVVGAGFQLANDWDNPYLSTNKIAGRVFWAGLGGAGSSIIGGALGGAALGAWCGPGVVICTPIGTVLGAIGGGLAWSERVQPIVYNWFGLNPSDRNIMPLNN